MPEETEHDFRQGAKAAAAAAAVAAAAGVARAIAAHAQDASEDDADVDERPEPAAEPEPEQEQHEEQEEPEQREERAEPVRGASVGRVHAITDRARATLEELSGIEAETVSAVERTPNGWRVTLEAVELRRVPDTTDLLATYEVELDGDGELVRYERGRRYSRSQSDDGSAR